MSMMICTRRNAGSHSELLLALLLQQHLVLILLLPHELRCRADQLFFSSLETLLQLCLSPAGHSSQLPLHAHKLRLGLCAKPSTQAAARRRNVIDRPTLATRAKLSTQLPEAPLHNLDLCLDPCLEFQQPLLKAPQLYRLSGSLDCQRGARSTSFLPRARPSHGQRRLAAWGLVPRAASCRYRNFGLERGSKP